MRGLIKREEKHEPPPSPCALFTLNWMKGKETHAFFQLKENKRAPATGWFIWGVSWRFPGCVSLSSFVSLQCSERKERSVNETKGEGNTHQGQRLPPSNPKVNFPNGSHNNQPPIQDLSSCSPLFQSSQTAAPSFYSFILCFNLMKET